MKKVLLLAIGASAITAFAVFYIFIDTNATDEVVIIDTSASEVSQTTTQEDVEVDSYSDLIGFTGDLECQVNINQPGQDIAGSIEGTLFVSGGNLRTDLLMEDSEFGVYAASVIVLPDFTYSWSQIEGQTYGVKMETPPPSTIPVETSSSPAFSDVAEYDCKVWESVDGSVFTPPSAVLFRDEAELEATGMEYGTIYEEELP